jgi:lipopolysaccharide export system protein LptC
MTVAPLVAPGGSPRAPRNIGGSVRPPPSSGAIARRRWFVGAAKRLLPLVAVALLAMVALWPELQRDVDRARLSYRRGIGMPESGQITAPRYNGVDERNQPFTVTADTARQAGEERIDMTAPKGDMSLTSGAWLMVQGKTGVYMQKAQQLDLTGDVWMYRDDGTTLSTDVATLDVRGGAVATESRTHVEGPFGTLEAQGFVALDRGQIIRFTGPVRLVLNQGKQ